MKRSIDSYNKDHSHEPKQLRKELLELLRNSSLKIDYLSAAATPLASVATSASVLTFLSLQLFVNGYQRHTRFIAGLNIILLLFMVFISLITQIMIYRAKLRLARVNHDLKGDEILECENFTPEQHSRLVYLSHLASKGTKTTDRIQWLYTHGLFRVLYAFIFISVFLLIFLTLIEIPFRI
jgi:ABC-type multidrug transport system fused ATPase/permease subunit